MLVIVATLGIAVVHYRTPEVAVDCLRRLREAAPGAAVVVVDTAPEAAFEARLAREFPEIEFLPTPNRSYSHSVNAGLARLGTDHLVQMNADVLVGPSTLSDLVAVLESDELVGVVAPIARTAGGAVQNMGLPYSLNYARLQRERVRASDSLPASVPVDWVGGYMQVIRRDVWQKSGGYDESFRFFNEDLDFCWRVRKLGRQCRLVHSPVVHLGGTSTPDDPAFHVEGRRGGMVITLRHHGFAFRLAHSAFLWAEALLGRTFSTRPERREAHQRVLAMLRSGRWHESPFGATLDERA